jgi:hypothetical protein
MIVSYDPRLERRPERSPGRAGIQFLRRGFERGRAVPLEERNAGVG